MRKIGFVSRDLAWICPKIDLKRVIELEVSTQSWIVNVIHSELEVVIVPALRDVVLELPLALERLLGNVGVGAEARAAGAAVVASAAREGDQRYANLAVDDVVPILEAEGEAIYCRVRQG